MPIIGPLGGSGSVSLLDLARIQGHLVIGCIRRRTIHFKDLATGLPIGRSILIDSVSGYVTSLAIVELEERLTAITTDLGGRDRARVWDAARSLERDIKVDGSVLP